jgi:hypothetical protein
MKVLIVALMALTITDGSRDIFVFTQPQFQNTTECVEYVQQNSRALMFRIYKEFPGDSLDRIMCIPEENVKKILEFSIPKSKPEIGA